MFKKLGNCGKSLNVRHWSGRNNLHKSLHRHHHVQGKHVERQGRKTRSLRLKDPAMIVLVAMD